MAWVGFQTPNWLPVQGNILSTFQWSCHSHIQQCSHEGISHMDLTTKYGVAAISNKSSGSRLLQYSFGGLNNKVSDVTIVTGRVTETRETQTLI